MCKTWSISPPRMRPKRKDIPQQSSSLIVKTESSHGRSLFLLWVSYQLFPVLFWYLVFGEALVHDATLDEIEQKIQVLFRSRRSQWSDRKRSISLAARGLCGCFSCINRRRYWYLRRWWW